MVYLNSFKLPNSNMEDGIVLYKKNIFNSVYPIRLFSLKEFENIKFEPITIFYGGNGSGKTTLINVIASSIGASRKNLINYGELFGQYVDLCKYDLSKKDLKEIKVILSDDVFDYLIDTKCINSRVNRRKDELAEEYLNYKYTSSEDFKAMISDYELLRNKVDANRHTVSKYVRERLRNNNIAEESNGETALDYWQNEIKDNAIYLIDEPENSLSAENQLKLRQFILDSARFYNCQFIIATHSPFLLSLPDALIYDLDSVPVNTKKWTELNNVRVYYDFFKEHEDEF